MLVPRCLRVASGVVTQRLPSPRRPGTIAGMSIFAGLTSLPPDPILGLVEEYNRDTRPGKVSLAAGVFVDETGITPVLDTVAEAEARILAAQTTKLYKPIAGDP